MPMYASHAVWAVRNKINDKDGIELADGEIMMCLNEAIQYVASYLIQANSPLMVREYTFHYREEPVPVNFVKTAGTFPIRTTQNTMLWIGAWGFGAPEPTMRYFASPYVMQLDDEVIRNEINSANSEIDDPSVYFMPFGHDALNQVVIKLATIYAGNLLEADVSQDKALLDEVNAALAQTIGGVKQ